MQRSDVLELFSRAQPLFECENNLNYDVKVDKLNLS